MESSKKRPFKQLEDIIKVDNETFVPLQKLAALAFNYNDQATKKEPQSWVNNAYDYKAWHTFNCPIVHPDDRYSFYIDRHFNTGIYFNLDGIKSQQALPSYNQVEILRCLQKWDFLDL